MSKFWNKIFGKRQKETVAEVKPQRELTDDEKHSYRYFLQYRFIPDLVAGVSKGKIPPNAIMATEGWQDFMKKHVDENFFLEWGTTTPPLHTHTHTHTHTHRNWQPEPLETHSCVQLWFVYSHC